MRAGRCEAFRVIRVILLRRVVLFLPLLSVLPVMSAPAKDTTAILAPVHPPIHQARLIGWRDTGKAGRINFADTAKARLIDPRDTGKAGRINSPDTAKARLIDSRDTGKARRIKSADSTQARLIDSRDTGKAGRINSPDTAKARKISPIRQINHWILSEKGVKIGYGYGVNRDNLPEGSYSPLFLIGKIGVEFPALNRRINPRMHLSLIIEPQLNLVLLRGPTSSVLAGELGIGIGLQNRVEIIDRVSVFSSILVGPQVYSAQTRRQAPGFLFSDNLGAGIMVQYPSKWALTVEFRIRHLSNGNFVLPNYGINTNNFLLGISHFLDR